MQELPLGSWGPQIAAFTKQNPPQVLAAVLTSQLAGAWLEFVLRKGWPLLTPKADRQVAPETAAEAPRAA